jgi:hypothetical protein
MSGGEKKKMVLYNFCGLLFKRSSERIRNSKTLAQLEDYPLLKASFEIYVLEKKCILNGCLLL